MEIDNLVVYGVKGRELGAACLQKVFFRLLETFSRTGSHLSKSNIFIATSLQCHKQAQDLKWEATSVQKVFGSFGAIGKVDQYF